MKKLTITLALIIFVASNMFAQLGEIKGFVKDKSTDEPLWNVSVYVETGGNLVGDAADFDGKFTIKPLKPGKYTVIAKMAGYSPMKIQNVQITSDKITYVNIDMEESAEKLPEFKLVEHVIPLISKDEPHVQMITAGELKQSVNRNDPIQIVGTMPGIQLADNGKDVYVRGSRPQSTQFITDGMKSITGDMGIPGQAIGSLKVYTGGVPARYGDVTGGVIVVETKSYFDLAQDY
jgi:hypothetical protein